MNIRRFILFHTVALLTITLVPKVAKLIEVHNSPDFGIVASVLGVDVLVTAALEALMFGLLSVLPRFVGKLLGALWGLTLLLVAGIAVIEHRYFLSTGQFLDLNLLVYGFAELATMAGGYFREASAIWWVMLALSVPFGFAAGIIGWRVDNVHAIPKRIGFLVVGVSLLVLYLFPFVFRVLG